MSLVRNITGTQTFADQPLKADVLKVRTVYFQELRDKTQAVVDDLDSHIGNYGIDHHKTVDYNEAGFESVEDKKKFDEHTKDHMGPDGYAHAVATSSHNGFMSAQMYSDLTKVQQTLNGHIGVGGQEQHPIATKQVAGFMSPAMVDKLERAATFNSNGQLVFPNGNLLWVTS